VPEITCNARYRIDRDLSTGFGNALRSPDNAIAVTEYLHIADLVSPRWHDGAGALEQLPGLVTEPLDVGAVRLGPLANHKLT
jgi:hypothetical protein